jgi:hypothetical protein
MCGPDPPGCRNSPIKKKRWFGQPLAECLRETTGTKHYYISNIVIVKLYKIMSSKIKKP